MIDAYGILEKPLITEKSMDGVAEGKYSFRVRKDANKIEIKLAIETIFSVKVGDVRTMQLRGKVKRQGRFAGRRSDWKKAIVTLKPDQKIELFEQI